MRSAESYGNFQKARQQAACCTRFDVYVASLLTFSFLVLSIVAAVIGNDNNLPNNRNLLNINGSITLDLDDGESVFLDVEIESDQVVCFTAEAVQGFIDLTFSLLDNSGNILVFEDDIAIDNFNPLLCHLGTSDNTLILEVNSLFSLGNSNFIVDSFLITDEVFVGEIFEKPFLSDEIFLSFVNLNKGEIYEVIAFSDVVLFDEIDTVIRLRSLEGLQITEAFQSSVTELTARAMFAAPASGEFILEVRQNFVTAIDVESVKILVIPREPQVVDITSGETFSFEAFELKSTLLQFQVSALSRLVFSFDFDEQQVESEIDINFLFGFRLEGSSAFMLSDTVIPGLSFRVLDVENNIVIRRARSDLEISNVLEDTPLQEIRIFFANVSHILTQFDVEVAEDKTLLLDISRWNPNYGSINNLEDFNNGAALFPYTFTVVQEQSNIDVTSVDPFNLFPECDIEPSKHVFADNSCDQGIVLFCRNEFFPDLDTQTALKTDFSNVCACTELLCSTLPSGSQLGKRFIGFLIGMSGIFAAVSFIPIIIYLVAVFDLSYYGGMSYWLQTSNAFKTWSMSVAFFVLSAIYFSTEIALGNIANDLGQIDNEFELFRIPAPPNELAYTYYEENFDLRNNYFDFVFEPADLSNISFLNEESKNLVPDITFETIKNIWILNLIAFALKNVLAIITFLDVSLVWIKSVRTVSLNKERQRKRVLMFSRLVRVIEIFFFVLISIVIIVYIFSEGQEYNVSPYVLVLLLSTLVLCMYVAGRLKLNYHFEISKLASDTKENEIWTRIKKTSAIVIACSAGVMVVQIYLLATVQNLEDFIQAGNNALSLTILLFQDICIFIGQTAIFYYLFKTYLVYRESLFVEEVVEEETRAGVTSEIQTKKLDVDHSSKKMAITLKEEPVKKSREMNSVTEML